METRRPVWRLTIIQDLKQDSDGSKAIRNGQTRCNLKVEPTGHTNIWKWHIREISPEKLQDCWPEQLKKQL